jgi:hypothetical protein
MSALNEFVEAVSRKTAHQAEPVSLMICSQGYLRQSQERHFTE